MNDTSDDRHDAVAEKAFREHVLPELDVLYRVALSITHNRADAEDLVQDTLLRSFRSIERFDGRHPRAWLLTIMRNAQLNRVRRKRPELLRDPDATFERRADATPGGVSAENHVVDELFDATVEQAFTQLPTKFRSVIELVDLDGLSYQEAADVLDVPVGTIMSRLHRARSRIRDHLREHGIRREGTR
jgi:RNA polymerase sigma-70 factor (ECF subfamily)